MKGAGAIIVHGMTEEDEMTPEERAELLASIDRGLDQAARGEGIPAEEVLRRLRSLG